MNFDLSTQKGYPAFIPDTKKKILPQKDPKDSPIVKVDLDLGPCDRKLPAFVLKNVLSPEECQYIIECSEKNGFQAAKDYCFMYRNRFNDRIESFDYNLADSLFERCKPFLPKELDSSVIEAKDYKIHSLNPKWRMCRYVEGHFFGGHCDGPFQEIRTKQSFLTFMIYLNNEGNDFEGGTTNFIDYKTHKIKNVVKPEAGMAIIFFQSDINTFHEGSKLTKGTKYILRTDLMFQKVIEED